MLFEGIVVLLLKKITQYWLKRPKKIVTTNFDPVLKRWGATLLHLNNLVAMGTFVRIGQTIRRRNKSNIRNRHKQRFFRSKIRANSPNFNLNLTNLLALS
jgi:hypothetical protein